MLGGATGGMAHSLFPGVDGQPRRLRAGRHGHGIRGHRAHAVHFRDHDLRDDPRLFDHRAADDFEYDQLLHLAATAAGADLRSARAAGRRLSADRRNRATSWRARR